MRMLVMSAGVPAMPPMTPANIDTPIFCHHNNGAGFVVHHHHHQAWRTIHPSSSTNGFRWSEPSISHEPPRQISRSLARSNDRMMSTSCVAAFHLLLDVIIGRESNGAVGSLAQQRGRETLIEAEDAALGHDAAHRSNEHRPLRLTLCICMVCVCCIHTSQSILSHSIHQSWPIDEIPTAVASCR